MACSGGGSLGKRKSPPPSPLFSFGQRVAFAVTLWTTDCDHNECSNWDVAISQVIEAFPSFFPYFVWEQKYRGREIKEMELLLRFSRPLEEIVKCLIFGVKIYCKYFFGPDYVKFPFLFFCILSRARDIAASCFEIPFVFSTEKKSTCCSSAEAISPRAQRKKTALGGNGLPGGE